MFKVDAIKSSKGKQTFHGGGGGSFLSLPGVPLSDAGCEGEKRKLAD